MESLLIVLQCSSTHGSISVISILLTKDGIRSNWNPCWEPIWAAPKPRDYIHHYIPSATFHMSHQSQVLWGPSWTPGSTIESELTVSDSFSLHISFFLIQKVNTDKVVAQTNMKTSQITMFVKTFHILPVCGQSTHVMESRRERPQGETMDWYYGQMWSYFCVGIYRGSLKASAWLNVKWSDLIKTLDGMWFQLLSQNVQLNDRHIFAKLRVDR